MKEQIDKWRPVSDIDCSFGSISYVFEHDKLQVRMVGNRTLMLRFSGVVAIRFKQECPGFDFLPFPLPMLGPMMTFPLLIVAGSKWMDRYQLIYGDLAHFALVSSDHLMQLLAKPNAEAGWE